MASAIWLAIALLISGRAASTQSFPDDLRSTGLYSDFGLKTIDPRNLHYSPNTLWSDGASKQRWIYLPPGRPSMPPTPIFGRSRRERRSGRVLVRRPPRGNALDRISRRAAGVRGLRLERRRDRGPAGSPGGLKNVVEIRPGVGHDIPGVWDCRACHVGDKEEILGFQRLQLSRTGTRRRRTPSSLGRDGEPGHPCREEAYSFLSNGMGLARPTSAASTAARPRGSRYMHANCGNCHNPSGPLESRGLILRYSVKPGAADEAALIVAGLQRPSRFPVPDTAPARAFSSGPATRAQRRRLPDGHRRIRFGRCRPWARKSRMRTP